MNWTILSVSPHSASQITRNLILEQAGYRVVTAGDMDEAVQLLNGSEVDAVVLADSINAENREQMGLSLKRLKPALPIVMLCKMSDSRRLRAIADEHVEWEDGPQSLLDALSRVLKRERADGAQNA